MIKPWTVAGDWWLPENPVQRWSGTLTWDPDGRSQLKVVGIVTTATGSSVDMGVGPTLILGCSHEGMFFTCYQTYYSGFSGGFQDTNYRISNLDVQTIFAKVHFERVEDIKFGCVRIRYSNLHEWYWGAPAMTKAEIPNEAGEYDGSKTTITHQRRHLWEMALPSGVTIESDYSYNSNHSDTPPSVTFTHTDGILIKAPVPSVLGTTFLDPELQFRTLVNLLGDYALQVESAKGGVDPEGSNDIDIYHLRLRRRRALESRDPQQSPALFSQLGTQRFTEILRTWIAVYEQVKTVAHLYLSDRFSGAVALDSTYLTVMQALEAYHHLFYPSHVYMDRGEYKRTVAAKLIEAIPPTLDETVKEKLEEILRYGYQYSLKKKLDEIVTELPANSLKNDVQAEGFLSRSVTTRNYLVHRDPEAAGKAFKDQSLYLAGCIWQEVIYSALLGRAGLNQAEITRAGGMMRYKRGTLQVVGQEAAPSA